MLTAQGNLEWLVMFQGATYYLVVRRSEGLYLLSFENSDSLAEGPENYGGRYFAQTPSDFVGLKPLALCLCLDCTSDGSRVKPKKFDDLFLVLRTYGQRLLGFLFDQYIKYGRQDILKNFPCRDVYLSRKRSWIFTQPLAQLSHRLGHFTRVEMEHCLNALEERDLGQFPSYIRIYQTTDVYLLHINEHTAFFRDFLLRKIS